MSENQFTGEGANKIAKTFAESFQCKSRNYCSQCRNDAEFRKRFEGYFNGPIVCPEKIEIGTPLEKMPQGIRDIAEKHKRQAVEQQKRLEEAKKSLSQLYDKLPPEHHKDLNAIANVFMPEVRETSKCLHSGETVGTTEEKCCGGKVKQVNQYVCQKHYRTTEKQCKMCGEFERKLIPLPTEGKETEKPIINAEQKIEKLMIELKGVIIDALKKKDMDRNSIVEEEKRKLKLMEERKNSSTGFVKGDVPDEGE